MAKYDWLSECKNCKDYVYFQPRKRFFRGPATPRDITAGSWEHAGRGGTRGCTGREPRDGRSPQDDVRLTESDPSILSTIRNGGDIVREKRRKIKNV